jgi:hypothetical protein
MPGTWSDNLVFSKTGAGYQPGYAVSGHSGYAAGYSGIRLRAQSVSDASLLYLQHGKKVLPVIKLCIKNQLPGHCHKENGQIGTL